MAVEPDRQGFRDAQARKREWLGEDITFYGDVTLEYAPGTPVDPETGHAYDPVMVASAASGQASAMVRCGVAFQPISEERRRPANPQSIGWTDDTHVLLNAPPLVDVSWARQFVLRGERYKILQMRDDAVGEGDPWRLMIHGRRE